MSESIYSVAEEGCLRCGACSTLAPRTFAMGQEAAYVLRQPETKEELAAAEAALFNCPVLAIRRKAHRG